MNLALAALLALLGADATSTVDEVPENYRKYFAAADAVKADLLEKREEELRQVRAAKRNPEPAKQALADVKKADSFAYFPTVPSSGQIGTVDSRWKLYLADELEGGTVLVATQKSLMVFRNANIENKPKNVVTIPGVWMVVDKKPKDVPEMKSVLLQREGPFIILEKVDPDELSKYRKLYVAQKKAKK